MNLCLNSFRSNNFDTPSASWYSQTCFQHSQHILEFYLHLAVRNDLGCMEGTRPVLLAPGGIREGKNYNYNLNLGQKLVLFCTFLPCIFDRHWHQYDFGTHHCCTPRKPTQQTLMILFPLRSQGMCSVPCLVDACLLCNQHNLLHLKYACLLDTRSMRLNLEQTSARLYNSDTLSAA